MVCGCRRGGGGDERPLVGEEDKKYPTDGIGIGRCKTLETNFGGLGLGCIEAKVYNEKCIFAASSDLYTICALLHRSKLNAVVKM